MTIQELEKPLKGRYEIQGVDDEKESIIAGVILMEVYNQTATLMNNGIIEMFNSSFTDDKRQGDEYINAYEKLFKMVSDEIASDTPYRLREHDPILLNFNEGYVTVYGYKI